MGTPFIGEIKMAAFNFAPENWALCNGQQMAISNHAALFALLGTAYGGNGTVNFDLPDFRGRVPVHPGVLAFHPAVQRGTQGGFEKITLTAMNSGHTHQVKATSQAADSKLPTEDAALGGAQGTAVPYVAPTSSSLVDMNVPVSVCGGGQSHANVQPSAVINFCIALEGVFPSRS